MKKKQLNRSSATLSIMAVLIVSGCSTTKDYEETISELQTALKSSIDTVAKIDADVTKEQNASWIAKVSSGSHGLIVQQNTCEGGADKCGLEIVEYADPPTIVVEAFPIESMMVKSQRALVALDRYLETLHAIAKVDTVGKVVEQTSKALVSLDRIKEEVARIQGTEVGTSLISSYSEPSGALFNWAVEAYVQNVKHDALATATKRAQPAVDSLNNLLSGVSEAVAKRALARAEDAFQDAQATYDAAETAGLGPSETAIKAYIRASVDNNQTRKAASARPLAEFTEAHRKLKKFLNNEGDVSLADAWDAIQRLKDKAKEFKTLAENFKPETP